MTVGNDPVSATGGPKTGLAHEAFFYADLDGFLAATVPFLRTGLDNGEPLLAAVPPAGIDALQAALGRDADAVTYVDMTLAGRNPAGIIPMVLHAFADEHPDQRICMVGEPTWPTRSAAGYLGAVQHEALINLAFADQDAAILCAYGTAGLRPTVREDVGRTHPFVYDNGTRTSSVQYADPMTVAASCLLPLPDPPNAPEAMTFGAASLRSIRRLVGAHAARAGMSEERIRELQIAVNEVATNTIVILGVAFALALIGMVADMLVQLNKRPHDVMPATCCRGAQRLTSELDVRLPPDPGGRSDDRYRQHPLIHCGCES